MLALTRLCLPTVVPALRRVAGIGITLVLVLALGLLALQGVARLVGAQALVVRSGSMRPTLGVGDLVVTRRVHATEVSPGDLVTFKDPSGAPRLITHRLRTVRPAGDALAMQTRGDANPVGEHWRVSRDGHLGRVVLHLPAAGRAWTRLGDPGLRLALAYAGLAGLAAIALAAIWRRS